MAVKGPVLGGLLLALVAIVMVSVGCSPRGDRQIDSATTAGKGTEAPVAASGAKEEALIKDDFSDPSSGFIRKDEGSYGADYRDGRYEVWVDNAKENYVASVGSLKGHTFTDASIQVTATPLSLPEGAGFGVLCRVSEDGRSEYAADVEKDGSVRLLVYDPDQKVLARGEVAPLADGPVTLRLDCIGDHLAFFVDGQEAASATDGALAQGTVGFTAGGGSEGMTRVAFDDLVVRAP